MHKTLRVGIVLLLSVSFILTTSCARHKAIPSASDPDPQNVKLFALYGGRDFFYAHVTVRKDLSEGKHFKEGEIMGNVMPYPKTFSKNYDKEIMTSRELYEQGQYQQAANVLKAPVEREPDNPFILEAYARALYKQNLRKESFMYYQRLINLLNNTAKKEDPDYAPAHTAIVIDFWFTDAYWKLGTLLLDRGEWAAAAFEISRFLLLAKYKCNDQPNVCVQAFSYLTEAYFEMKEYAIAKYYAQVTLQMDPANQYVKNYLSGMPKGN